MRSLGAVPRPRPDALPEFATYIDTGCEVAPKCLECPLAVCRFDTPGGARAIRNRVRDPEIIAALAAGEHPDAVAARFHVSRRTVFRIKAEGPR